MRFLTVKVRLLLTCLVYSPKEDSVTDFQRLLLHLKIFLGESVGT